MPLAYDPNTMTFGEAPSGFGDSVLTIDITNSTTTNFVYPLAKLIPVTPFPPGMTLAPTSTAWYSFASSWNTGETAPASFFFHVTQPIPADFTVTFDLYVSNFLPLTIDSCVFATPVHVNFNPVLSLDPAAKNSPGLFSLFPNPAVNELCIKFNNPAAKINELSMYDMSGKMVKTWQTRQTELHINTGRIESGVYYLVSKNTLQRQKVIIAH
jgi:hypothetical protein